MQAAMQKYPGWWLQRRQFIGRPLRQSLAGEALQRFARTGALSIGLAVKYRNGKRLEDVLPTAPTGKFAEIVGAHDPDKMVARIMAAKMGDGIGAVAAVKAPFAIAYLNRRVAGQLTRRRQALIEGRHAALGFKRILRRHQPPQLIQCEPFDRLQADMEMAFMGRVKGAAKEADAPAFSPRHIVHRRRSRAGGRALQGFQGFQGRT